MVAAFFDQLGRRNRLATRRAIDGGNRYAPRALARDAPVRAARDHVGDAIVAPRRHPLHVVIDGVKRRLAQVCGCPPSDGDRRFAVHADEPLRRRQEDDRMMAAPAVRVLMREIGAMPEPRALLQFRFDRGVRIEDALPAKQVDRVEEMAGRADGRQISRPYF